VSELKLKNQLKDGQLENLRMSQQSDRGQLGESESSSADAAGSDDISPAFLASNNDALKELPADVRKVEDFYQQDPAPKDDTDDLGEAKGLSSGPGYLTSSPYTWTLKTERSGSEAALVEEFPESFGTLTVTDGNRVSSNSDLGESADDSCKTTIPDEMCMDDASAHQWIEYKSDKTCGPQLCINTESKQVCLSKESFEKHSNPEAATQSFSAKCSNTGDAYNMVMMNKTGKNKIHISRTIPSDEHGPENRQIAVEALKLSMCKEAGTCTDRKVLVSCNCVVGCEHPNQACMASDQGIAMMYL